MAKLIDLSGRKFGRLLVLERGIRPQNTKHWSVYWQCKCDCGAVVTIAGMSLTSGHTVSCGCKRRKTGGLTSHKGVRHPLFKIWMGIRWRCLNPRSRQFSEYGGRGIAICQRWLKFDMFVGDLAEMIGDRPDASYSLDRIDNDGNYEPGNVRWATPSQQNKNKRGSRCFEANAFLGFGA